MQTVQDMHVLC